MSGLIDTTEMYLRTIYELMEEGVAPLRARIAERLQQSGPTVSQTVARMERDGLLHVHADRHLMLTEEGERLAMDVMRRHRLAERLLLDVVGLEWPLVHEEACKWEHVIGSTVEAKLDTLLSRPELSPYGTPIPRDTDSVAEALARFRRDVESLAEVLDEGHEGAVTLVRIGEYLQREMEALSVLCGAGIRPGGRIHARRDRTRLTLTSESG
ncbi:MAG: metal-dependent transcriptional regulator, partial [Propionibacteriaceae bacterium]|nr:metal-dependent transcriptional regulator [Propionibacteriaceae bacterium]